MNNRMLVLVRRIVSGLLAVAICCSFTSTAWADTPDKDVPEVYVSESEESQQHNADTQIGANLNDDTQSDFDEKLTPAENVVLESGEDKQPDTHIDGVSNSNQDEAVGISDDTVPVESIALNSAEVTLSLSEKSVVLSAIITPENATNQEINWFSDDPAVVTVDDGCITLVGVGTTTVTAKTLDSEHSATCQVTVLPVSSEGEAAQKPGDTDKPVNTNNAEQQEDAVLDEEASKENEEKNKTVLVTSLRIVEPVPILTVGTPYSLDNLQLKFTPEDATNTNVTWTSENDTIVTVADGTITPVAEGETYITAKTVDGSEQSAKFEVTVEAPVSIKSIQVNYPSKENLHGFSFSPDITNYNIEIADGVACNFFITPDNLPQNKCFFAQLYKDGQPIKGKNGGVAPGTFTRKNELKVDKNPKVTLMASNGPALGTSGSYSILIGTKENDVPTANFTKIYCTYNFNISTKMPRLGTLKIADEKNATIAPTPSFNASKVYVADYSMVVPASSSYIQLTATAKTAGVTFLIGGETYNQLSAQRITLDDFKTDIPLVYRIPICLQKTGEFVAENTYYLTVTKKNPTPVILSQPGESTNYIVEYQKGESTSLSVTVQAPEEGELSYQWFSRTSGTYKAIPDAKESTYIPDTSRAGSILYKCAITNTLDGIEYSVDTKDITVKVNLTSVDKPQILLQPGTFVVSKASIFEEYKTEYSFGEMLNQIFIALDDPEAGEVYSYKWYFNTKNSTENGIPLEESHIGSSKTEGKYCQGFVISHTFEPGIYYLYCEVTASSESNPELSAVTISKPVKILFNKVQLSDFIGSGTEDNPFLIQSIEDLQKLRDLIEDRQYCTGLKFLMTTDLTLPEDWQPIGRPVNSDEAGNGLPYMGYCVFRGIFDGGKHTLTIPEGGKPLFNYVSSATIQNLNIYGCKINGYGLIDSWFTDYGEDNKWNYGDPYCVTIDNVKLLSGSQTLYSGFLGGSGSGINTVTIRNSTIEKGVVVGYDREQNNIGSFVGGAFNGVIENSVSYADVYGKNEVGGLAAGKGQTMGLCAVRNSQFHGNIVATGSKVGGIIARGYADVGERSAWNSPWVTVEGCTVTGSITGGNYVGGIFGVEDCTVQCWGNDFGESDFSASSSGRIQNNRFEGTIHSTGKYVGGIVGYIEALNRFTIVSNNYYRAECGVDTGIGYVRYVDTSCKTHETSSGAIYFNTSESLPGIQGVSQKNCDRTDDPLGADSEKLCYTDKPIENYVEELVLSGTYKTVYEVGDAFDLTGMEFSAKWKDGTTEKLSTDKITFTGFSTAEAGVKSIIAEYKGATKIFTITVMPKSTKITVTISVLGDSAHGDNGQVHGLAMGGLQPWISATEYEADASETLWQVLKRVFDAHGFDYSNSSGNYIASINGLSEFTNGKNSGWMYTLNGTHPTNGVNEQYLKNGDVIVFHYTDDYTKEEGNMGPVQTPSTAKAVMELIEKIGTVTYTDACKEKIDAARKAYDALDKTEQAKVTNYAKLTAAEKKYDELKLADDKAQAKKVDDLISKIGTVTANSGPAITAAWDGYNGLTAEQKGYVTKLATLQEATRKWNQLKADAVIKLIDQIVTPVTAQSKASIDAARKAYDALNKDQQALVTNIKKLTDAETAYAKLTATPSDKNKAQEVMDKISKIGNVTKDSEQDIKDARKAYDALTDLQKLLVDNYETLTAAETKFAMLDTLGKVSDPYINTGDYMEKLGTPNVGAIGGEWMVIGLARSGRTVPGVEDYYQKAVEYVQQSIDPDTGRLHKAKSTDNSRMILALTAIGKDVTNVGGYNLLAGLSDLEYVKYQGNNGPIWALLALDSGNYPVPSGGTTTRQALIDEILRVQTSDGGWTVSGDKADSDMTGMALTALAPYYTKDLKVQEAIDKAIARLSEMQDEDGGYSTSYDGTTKIATSESISQVVTALSALGINADTDPRFVKNGNSVIDALLRYYVKGGGFKHIMDGELDGMATEQAYYALTAYYRFLSGKTNLYDMTDIIDMGGDPVEIPTEPTVPATTEPTEVEPAKTGFPWWILVICVVGGCGLGMVIAIVIIPKFGKFKKKD